MNQCPVCRACDVKSFGTIWGQRLYCPACFHEMRLDTQHKIDYTARAVRRDYTTGRAESQIQFIRPILFTGINIFEIGCAEGFLAASIKRSIRVGLYDGSEVSPDRITAANILDTVYTAWPIEHIEPHSYDLVICSHVLEHLEDLDQAVRGIVELCSKRGFVFIEVPNRSGHPNIPYDTNPQHRHSFSNLSLSLLLAKHGLEVNRVMSGAFERVRYPDSLRVLARPNATWTARNTALSDVLNLPAGTRIVVWGAGGMTQELLVPFFDPDYIMCFVDKDPTKQGTRLLGKPIFAPEHLSTLTDVTLLISSLDYESEIRQEIAGKYPSSIQKIYAMSDLLKIE